MAVRKHVKRKSRITTPERRSRAKPLRADRGLAAGRNRKKVVKKAGKVWKDGFVDMKEGAPKKDTPRREKVSREVDDASSLTAAQRANDNRIRKERAATKHQAAKKVHVKKPAKKPSKKPKDPEYPNNWLPIPKKPPPKGGVRIQPWIPGDPVFGKITPDIIKNKKAKKTPKKTAVASVFKKKKKKKSYIFR